MSGRRPPRGSLPAAWVDVLAEFETYERAAGLSAGTIRLRRHYLTVLAGSLPDPWAATLQILARFVADAGTAAETRKSARSAVRAFYAFAAVAGYLPASPAAVLPAVRVPEGVPRPAPDAVVADALGKAGPRERLMLDLGMLAGLRRAEIARVHRDDVDEQRGTLRVVGKGGKVRSVPLHPVLLEALVAYVPADRYAADLARDPATAGYLFPGKCNGHISPDRVGVILGDLVMATPGGRS